MYTLDSNDFKACDNAKLVVSGLDVLTQWQQQIPNVVKIIAAGK